MLTVPETCTSDIVNYVRYIEKTRYVHRNCSSINSQYANEIHIMNSNFKREAKLIVFLKNKP